jgi:hypothetical protein
MPETLKRGIIRASLAFAVLVLVPGRETVATESTTDVLVCKLSQEVIDGIVQHAARVPKPTHDQVLDLFRERSMDRLTLWLDLGATPGGAATMQYGGKTREVAYMISDSHIMLMTADGDAPNSAIDRTTGRLHLALSTDMVLIYECEKQTRRF